MPARDVAVDALRLRLPRASGAAFASPFRYEVVAGAQKVTGDLPADRAVDCGTDPTAASASASTICIDYRTADLLREPVTDVGIAAGQRDAQPGAEGRPAVRRTVEQRPAAAGRHDLR